MNKNFYGHTKEDPATGKMLPKEDWQLLKEHLDNVAEKAGEFASKFGAGKLGEILGRMHDLGKYSEEFQKRLEGSRHKVDHTTAGAKEALSRYGFLYGKLLAFSIAGHHGGLPDGTKGGIGNLPERLAKADLPEYSAFEREISFPPLTPQDLSSLPDPKCAEMNAFSLEFLIHMLYSCLVDADYLDTEQFMTPEKAELRPNPTPSAEQWEALHAKLEELLHKLKARNLQNPSPINTARQDILSRCIKQADSPPGLFTLTVPTGGGKTYSSLAFGLKHVVRNRMERIIYVIPFCNIIEQNAQVFRDALGDDAILEHHSNYEYPEDSFEDWSEQVKKHRLASENWNKPLVVTTAVQFFESLFSNKSSRCRKLHRIANSVIILDEAQMMPVEFLKPCLWALAELVLNYGSTVILCTATQPAVSQYLPGHLKPTEIMEDPKKLHQLFKRTIVEDGGEMTDEQVARAMLECSQVLTIVNTRKHARRLYDSLAGVEADSLYHLSARMCPAHRKQKLQEIHQALNKKQTCRVVATQLVEAGVDLDFPVVFRAAAGIDSIAQAAGRCNREGKLPSGRVVVFDPEKHGMPTQGRFTSSAALTRSTQRRIHELGGDLLSPEAIQDYFLHLFHQESENHTLDAHGILSLIQNGFDPMDLRIGKDALLFQFADIAKNFQLIDHATVPIVIPYDDQAKRLMAQARESVFPGMYARSLQPFTIQIYSYEYSALVKDHAIEKVGELFHFLTDESLYGGYVGLMDTKEVMAPDQVWIF